MPSGSSHRLPFTENSTPGPSGVEDVPMREREIGSLTMEAAIGEMESLSLEKLVSQKALSGLLVDEDVPMDDLENLSEQFIDPSQHDALQESSSEDLAVQAISISAAEEADDPIGDLLSSKVVASKLPSGSSKDVPMDDVEKNSRPQFTAVLEDADLDNQRDDMTSKEVVSSNLLMDVDEEEEEEDDPDFESRKSASDSSGEEDVDPIDWSEHEDGVNNVVVVKTRKVVQDTFEKELSCKLSDLQKSNQTLMDSDSSVHLAPPFELRRSSRNATVNYKPIPTLPAPSTSSSRKRKPTMKKRRIHMKASFK